MSAKKKKHKNVIQNTAYPSMQKKKKGSPYFTRTGTLGYYKSLITT